LERMVRTEQEQSTRRRRRLEEAIRIPPAVRELRSEPIQDDSAAVAERDASYSMERRRSISETWERGRHLAKGRGIIIKFVGQLFPKLLSRWQSVEEPPPPSGRLANLVTGRTFESLCIWAIVINAGFSWYATNYEVSHIGEEPSSAITNTERFFVCFYTVEWVLKLIVYRLAFFYNSEMSWNIFDTVLVGFSLSDMMISLFDSPGASAANITFVRVLRIAKMAKLLRGLRVIRFVGELRLILNSLVGSISGLSWSIIMLTLVFYVFGLIFVQGASTHLTFERDTMTKEEEEMIHQWFGSVEAAMMAQYMAVSGGEDWNVLWQVTSLLGIPYKVLFVLFIAFSQIAFLNVLTAIFVNRALELAQPDRETQAAEHRRNQLEVKDELEAMFGKFVDKDGKIDVEEMRRFWYSPSDARLSFLGLDVLCPDEFLELVRHTTRADPNNLTLQDIVDACLHMRGAASGVQVFDIDRRAKQLEQTVMDFRTNVEEGMRVLTEFLAVVDCKNIETL